MPIRDLYIKTCHTPAIYHEHYAKALHSAKNIYLNNFSKPFKLFLTCNTDDYLTLNEDLIYCYNIHCIYMQDSDTDTLNT